MTSSMETVPSLAPASRDLPDVAFDRLPLAMLIVDRKGCIVKVNAEAKRLFGYSAEELSGQLLETLVPQRFRSTHPAFRQGFFASPDARPMGAGRDLYALRKDGTEFPVEIGLNPIETNDGPMVLSSIVDITERRRLEERFRQVVEFAPSAMVMSNRDGRIVMVNQQTEHLFGYRRDELVGQPVEMLVPQRYRGPHPAFRASFLANPNPRSMGAGRDLFALRKDGTEFPVEIGLNPIETREGQMVLSAIVDITERKRTEMALRESEERFRFLVEGVEDYGIFMLDPSGHVVSWNAGAQKMKGYRADEILGQHVCRF